MSFGVEDTDGSVAGSGCDAQVICDPCSVEDGIFVRAETGYRGIARMMGVVHLVTQGPACVENSENAILVADEKGVTAVGCGGEAGGERWDGDGIAKGIDVPKAVLVGRPGAQRVEERCQAWI